MNDAPDAFGDALALVQSRLTNDSQLTIDQLWGEPPHLAVARFGNQVVTGKGDTPAAALRDLARQLPDCRQSDDIAGH